MALIDQSERRPNASEYLLSTAYTTTMPPDAALYVEAEDFTDTETERLSENEGNEYGFTFPEFVDEDVQSYLIAMYEQALDACIDTAYPDPFMAMALSVIEKPVSNHEVFRLPLVYQDTLNAALKDSGGSYAAAIERSDTARSFNRRGCVGPLQIAVVYVAAEERDPTVWSSSARMFYEDATLAIPGMTTFAERCGLDVTDMLMYTLSAMRHNVGNLSDWAQSSLNGSPARDFIPFTTRRAVYEWCAAIASDEGQALLKRQAVESYWKYLGEVYFTNGAPGWRELARVTGYDTGNILSGSGHRPLYPVSFWHNYYLLCLLYGVDTPESLGVGA